MSQVIKIKFGILCNSLVFETWEAACINHLIQHPSIELKLLVVNNNPSASKPSFLSKLKNYPYRNFLFRAYKRYWLKAASFNHVSFEDQFLAIPKLACQTIKKGKYGEYFKEEDIAKIKAEELDFMLRFGFNIIKGDILQSCKHGIWSFHHADNDFIRGGPIGFWEIYLKQNITAAVLQKLNNELDQGQVLSKGYLKTVNHSYAENIDQLAAMTAAWPLQVCIDLLNNVEIVQADSIQDKKAPLYKYPKNWQFLNFILVLLKNKFKFHIKQLFYAESWQISRYEGSLDTLLNGKLLQPTYISKSAHEMYFADPFLWPNNSKKIMLFEYFSYKENKGKIAMSDFDGKHFKTLDFGLKTHMSYPFCFEYNNQVYCLPEQAEAGLVSLYTIDENGEITKLHDLIQDFEARDSSLIFYEERWWLFCTKANNFENAALYLFYADSLSQSFLPHQNNPVKVDVQNARPAGSLFIKNNMLYRPAQNSAKHYGHKVNINKIKLLNTCAFQEEICEIIEPETFGNYSGIHHIAHQNGQVVIDLKQTKFSWHNFKNQCRRKLNKISKSV